MWRCGWATAPCLSCPWPLWACRARRAAPSSSCSPQPPPPRRCTPPLAPSAGPPSRPAWRGLGCRRRPSGAAASWCCRCGAAGGEGSGHVGMHGWMRAARRRVVVKVVHMRRVPARMLVCAGGGGGRGGAVPPAHDARPHGGGAAAWRRSALWAAAPLDHCGAGMPGRAAEPAAVPAGGQPGGVRQLAANWPALAGCHLLRHSCACWAGARAGLALPSLPATLLAITAMAANSEASSANCSSPLLAEVRPLPCLPACVLACLLACRRGACPSALCWWTLCWRHTARPSAAPCSSATWCRGPAEQPRWWPRGAGVWVEG